MARMALQHGLVPTEHPLKTKPEWRHWHLRKPGCSGTLEATWDGSDLHFTVRSNRAAPWIDEILGQDPASSEDSAKGAENESYNTEHGPPASGRQHEATEHDPQAERPRAR